MIQLNWYHLLSRILPLWRRFRRRFSVRENAIVPLFPE
jgi:hypothetical protein